MMNILKKIELPATVIIITVLIMACGHKGQPRPRGYFRRIMLPLIQSPAHSLLNILLMAKSPKAMRGILNPGGSISNSKSTERRYISVTKRLMGTFLQYWKITTH